MSADPVPHNHTVLVLGVTGQVGEATVRQLLQDKPSSVKVVLGAPDVSQASSQFPEANVVSASIGSPQLSKAIGQVKPDVLCIMTPLVANRAEVVISTLESAANSAVVKHVVVLSVAQAGSETIFGTQMGQIEAAVKEGHLAWTLVQLPAFFESTLAQVDTVRAEGLLYSPRDPSVPCTEIALEDAAKAITAVLLRPDEHDGKTYLPVAPPHTLNDLASELSRACGKEVKFAARPAEEHRKALLDSGVVEWQVAGYAELDEQADQGELNFEVKAGGDFRKITGEDPQTLAEWVEAHKQEFGQD